MKLLYFKHKWSGRHGTLGPEGKVKDNILKTYHYDITVYFVSDNYVPIESKVAELAFLLDEISDPLPEELSTLEGLANWIYINMIEVVQVDIFEPEENIGVHFYGRQC